MPIDPRNQNRIPKNKKNVDKPTGETTATLTPLDTSLANATGPKSGLDTRIASLADAALDTRVASLSNAAAAGRSTQKAGFGEEQSTNQLQKETGHTEVPPIQQNTKAGEQVGAADQGASIAPAAKSQFAPKQFEAFDIDKYVQDLKNKGATVHYPLKVKHNVFVQRLKTSKDPREIHEAFEYLHDYYATRPIREKEDPNFEKLDYLGRLHKMATKQFNTAQLEDAAQQVRAAYAGRGIEHNKINIDDGVSVVHPKLDTRIASLADAALDTRIASLANAAAAGRAREYNKITIGDENKKTYPNLDTRIASLADAALDTRIASLANAAAAGRATIVQDNDRGQVIINNTDKFTTSQLTNSQTENGQTNDPVGAIQPAFTFKPNSDPPPYATKEDGIESNEIIKPKLDTRIASMANAQQAEDIEAEKAFYASALKNRPQIQQDLRHTRKIPVLGGKNVKVQPQHGPMMIDKYGNITTAPRPVSAAREQRPQYYRENKNPSYVNSQQMIADAIAEESMQKQSDNAIGDRYKVGLGTYTSLPRADIVLKSEAEKKKSINTFANMNWVNSRQDSKLGNMSSLKLQLDDEYNKRFGETFQYMNREPKKKKKIIEQNKEHLRQAIFNRTEPTADRYILTGREVMNFKNYYNKDNLRGQTPYDEDLGLARMYQNEQKINPLLDPVHYPSFVYDTADNNAYFA